MLSRTILLVGILLAVGALLALAEDPPARDSDGPASLPELERDLAKTAKRLDDLVERAVQDPRTRLVELYQDYTIEQFGDPGREVEAEHLLDIMTDEDAPEVLRDKAFAALSSTEAMQFDPDLVLMRGRRKQRATWCRSRVTKLLKDRDVKTRTYASDLLKVYFKTLSRVSVVQRYDPVRGTRKDWDKTVKYWNKALLK